MNPSFILVHQYNVRGTRIVLLSLNGNGPCGRSFGSFDGKMAFVWDFRAKRREIHVFRKSPFASERTKIIIFLRGKEINFLPLNIIVVVISFIARLHSQNASFEVHFEFIWFELRNIQRNGELLIIIYDLNIKVNISIFSLKFTSERVFPRLRLSPAFRQ